MKFSVTDVTRIFSSPVAGFRLVDVVELQDFVGRTVLMDSPGLHANEATVRAVREAPTIVLIGAGSASFGLTTLHDLYADPVFTGATVRLVDLEPAPLERMAQVAAALEAATARGITVERYTERADALPGADAVVVSVEVDRLNRWLLDFEIPRRYGIDHLYGENGGPGGLAHTLRTVPLVASIARDVERLAPDALFVNFTNPEGRICTAFRRHLDQPVIGLCHEVKIANDRFSKLLGRRIDTRAAGLNHFTFLLEAWDRKTGADVTPQLHDAVDRLVDGDGETFAFVKHLHDRFGAIVATSDSHAGEYFRSATEYTEPLDIAARQHADAIDDRRGHRRDPRGFVRSRTVPALGDRRRAAPDPAGRDLRCARTARVGDPAQRRPRSPRSRRQRGGGERDRDRRPVSSVIAATTSRSRSRARSTPR